MFLLVTALFILLAPASDDEGSTAATDGSTLRTSPADHGGSVGSESGGSAVDSVAGEHSGECLLCTSTSGVCCNRTSHIEEE